MVWLWGCRTCVCTVLCSLKPHILKKQAELSLGSLSPAWRRCEQQRCCCISLLLLSFGLIAANYIPNMQSPPHGPSSPLVTPKMLHDHCSLLILAGFFFGFFFLLFFFPLAWVKKLMAHTWSWQEGKPWLGASTVGLPLVSLSHSKKDWKDQGKCCSSWKAQGDCCPGRIELLKIIFFSGAKYCPNSLSLYCSVFALSSLTFG